jgi:hypothetical protein
MNPLDKALMNHYIKTDPIFSNIPEEPVQESAESEQQKALQQSQVPINNTMDPRMTLPPKDQSESKPLFDPEYPPLTEQSPFSLEEEKSFQAATRKTPQEFAADLRAKEEMKQQLEKEQQQSLSIEQQFNEIKEIYQLNEKDTLNLYDMLKKDIESETYKIKDPSNITPSDIGNYYEQKFQKVMSPEEYDSMQQRKELIQKRKFIRKEDILYPVGKGPEVQALAKKRQAAYMEDWAKEENLRPTGLEGYYTKPGARDLDDKEFKFYSDKLGFIHRLNSVLSDLLESTKNLNKAELMAVQYVPNYNPELKARLNTSMGELYVAMKQIRGMGAHFPKEEQWMIDDFLPRVKTMTIANIWEYKDKLKESLGIFNNEMAIDLSKRSIEHKQYFVTKNEMRNHNVIYEPILDERGNVTSKGTFKIMIKGLIKGKPTNLSIPLSKFRKLTPEQQKKVSTKRKN